MILTPEQLTEVNKQIETAKSNLQEGLEMLGGNVRSRHSLGERIKKNAESELATLHQKLRDHKEAVDREEHDKKQAEERAAERARQEAKAKEIAESRAKAEKEAQEKREREEEKRRKQREEDERIRRETAKRKAEQAEREKLALSKKRAEDRRAKEEAERRFTLEADGKGSSQKWSLRLKLDDQEVDLLIEAKPVKKPTEGSA